MADRSWYDGILERVDAGDAEGFVSYLTDDATFKWGARDAVHGNDAVREFVDAFLDMFDGTQHVLTETLEHGDTRVCRGTVTYFTRDGREIPTPFCNVFHMEGDKIRDYLIYIDPSPLAG
ncbi:MAG: nuclear transport factor 2 family protein [Candidatus Longimicrobiales bacterium M2_2A_002]